MADAGAAVGAAHAIVSRFHRQFIRRQCPGKVTAPRVLVSGALQ
jgi:hypothetical protein